MAMRCVRLPPARSDRLPLPLGEGWGEGSITRALAAAITLACSCTTVPAQPGPPAPAASTAAAHPLASHFNARKVVQDPNGAEQYEDAANVSAGDIVQYSATHTNTSGRRLLRVDFGIPIPPGTSYVEGSASPAGATRVRQARGREQMHWRVPVMEPGETLEFSLRVRIEVDPTLTPIPAPPRKPELRR